MKQVATTIDKIAINTARFIMPPNIFICVIVIETAYRVHRLNKAIRGITDLIGYFCKTRFNVELLMPATRAIGFG